MISFYKANSIGNTIGVIPDQENGISWTPECVRLFCGKRWGIDCDQMMVMGPKVDIWNRNGTQAKACGNGMRCIIAVLKKKEDIQPLQMNGPVGIVEGWRQSDDQISILQGNVSVGTMQNIKNPPHTIFFQDIGLEGIPVHVGNPHAVIMHAPPDNLSPEWQPTHPFFPTGVNVSFVSSVNDTFFVQTWERGVGRTLSCGSGACAVAATLHAKGKVGQTVTLHTPGGIIHLHSTVRGWVHTAPAHIIAKGYWFFPENVQ